ncbi:uncharacterized protein BXZ73DRAFT_44130 [Epithele typhae]|uniref:uncharacterized protein n=1 Tax=Epithele typhae TaxID=378194 RepID=UPI002008A60E|nr:uncharacterized protein BXZ73DRAFT_44130 [Epithele typhae]KAH9939083.1 hypothetical protein BXZ73DRAFT_44130 [Epithele typhae]
MPPMAFIGEVAKVGVMNKTATVVVSRLVAHKRTGKMLNRSTKILAHDEKNELHIRDTVLIRNCPPISARKRFTLERIIKSPVADREALHARQAAEAAATAAGVTQAGNQATSPS